MLIRIMIWFTHVNVQFDVSIDDQKPTENELNRFLTKYCTLWRPIGLKLGLQTCVLDMVKSSHHTEPRECFRVTLQKWLQLDGDNATWQTLELAITNAKREELDCKLPSHSDTLLILHILISRISVAT